MGNNNAKTSKFVAMITYIIALVCLILGLFLPLGNLEAVTGADSIMALQLPKALGILFNSNMGGDKIFTYTYAINFLGLMGDKSFDIGAVLVLLYAFITALGVLMLIPVIACKRTSGAALKIASFIEVVALLFVASLVFTQLTFASYSALAGSIGGAFQVEVETGFKWSYALLIAFGGTLLMLIVQTFIYRKGSGIFKFFLFLLSAIAVLFTMFPVTLIVTMLATPLDKLAESFKLATGLYGQGGFEGISQLIMFFSAKYFDLLGGETLQKLLSIGTLILAALVFVNFMCDMMGLGKKTNSLMLVCNIIRYVLEVAAVILVFVAIIVLKDATIKIGLMLILLAIIAVLQLIINIIRLIRFRHRKSRKAKNKEAKKEKKKKEKENKGEPAADVYTPYTSPAYAPVAEKADEKVSKREERRAEKEAEREAREAEKEARKAEAEAEAERKAAEKAAKKAAKDEPASAYEAPKAAAKNQPVYNVETLYNGPVDDFIRKLSNQERIEFAQVFLERSKCSIANVPDYVVGGNNAKFFSSVFIYYGRIRDYVSDGLMNKIYEECNVM